MKRITYSFEVSYRDLLYRTKMKNTNTLLFKFNNCVDFFFFFCSISLDKHKKVNNN